MADEQIDISEKIARQIEKITKESLEINLKILQFIREDLEEIKKLAEKEGISTMKLATMVAEGLKKGLLRSGKVSADEINKILEISNIELPKALKIVKKEESTSPPESS